MNASACVTCILASRLRGTFDIGVTNTINARVEQHREGIGSAFTRTDKKRRSERSDGSSGRAKIRARG